MTAFKICCTQSLAEARMAVAAGAAAFGLVGRMPSGPGPIPDARIAEIAAAMKGSGALSVLLTCETRAAEVVAHVARCGTDAVQLVDAVEPQVFSALRAACPGVTILQVIHVQDAGALGQARAAATVADMLLLDSGAPQRAVKELGGTGRVHDWAISARIVAESPVPVWVAGGLNPGNAAEAVARVRPHGLDICSGLRPEGGLDATLLAGFVAAIRGAEPPNPVNVR